jgi:SAM-dependent methyltransferase
MSDELPTPRDVVRFYSSDVEVDRLERGLGAVEFERTKELIARFVPPRSAVADVGGAAGHYAEWLVENGHRVELVDPVPHHLELARRRAGDPPRFGVHGADARALPFADRTFDAVLLLGPLYHLGERHDRVAAVREAARVCRPSGVVLAAAISRYGFLLDCVRLGAIFDDRVFANVKDEAVTGRRVPAERRTSAFPDAYFHLAHELESELADGGLAVQGVYGVEGPSVLFADLDELWRDPNARQRVLEVARATETDRNLFVVSSHLLAVGIKPGAHAAGG